MRENKKLLQGRKYECNTTDKKPEKAGDKK